MFFYGQNLVAAAWTEVSFFPSLSILSMHCFSPTLEVPRKQIFTQPEDYVKKKNILLYRGHLSLNKLLGRGCLDQPLCLEYLIYFCIVICL